LYRWRQRSRQQSGRASPSTSTDDLARRAWLICPTLTLTLTINYCSSYHSYSVNHGEIEASDSSEGTFDVRPRCVLAAGPVIRGSVCRSPHQSPMNARGTLTASPPPSSAPQSIKKKLKKYRQNSPPQTQRPRSSSRIAIPNVLSSLFSLTH
jgi:hypothetical protein